MNCNERLKAILIVSVICFIGCTKNKKSSVCVNHHMSVADSICNIVNGTDTFNASQTYLAPGHHAGPTIMQNFQIWDQSFTLNVIDNNTVAIGSITFKYSSVDSLNKFLLFKGDKHVWSTMSYQYITGKIEFSYYDSASYYVPNSGTTNFFTSK